MTRTISKAGRASAVQLSSSLDPRHRRTRLLASSMLCGGTLRGLAVAAGMMTALGVSPAFAQCFSGTTGNLLAAGCNVAAAIGASSTAVGQGAEANGAFATVYGNTAVATGTSTRNHS